MQFGPGFTATFLYYFATTGVIFTLVAMQSMGLSPTSGLPQQLGIAGGLVAGLIGAYFNRSMTIAVPLSNQKKKLAPLETALRTMGYQQVSEEDTVRVYERSNLSKWLSGKIYVQIEKDQATIAGRAVHIRRLQKEL
jgi:hypothetical protein